ncbi:MAG: hypothetical protein Q9M94_04405 [Candidatus Gracilibacteria bacterium]|nr:hypothetical protein [Candidatus Gracilibacteria bacterium]MDQ7023694.1 hypothetical protein [Candidatus Gracilibacteria bacterium]
MFLDKKATSIIEAMVVILIVVTGVIGMFKVYTNSQKLSASTANKIQAIQIAREGIEGVKNIRDTNWILFASDNKNCWNVFDYNNSCIGDTSSDKNKFDILAGSYKISQNSDNRWYLDLKRTTETLFSKSDYRNEMEVGLDINGFFTQSGAVSEIIPLFTREIKISYTTNSNDPKMEVISVVRWKDLASNRPHKVEFKSILTNWKK